MIFLAVEQENKNGPAVSDDRLLREEALKVHQLYLEGIVREIYFNEDHCAIMKLECRNKAEAEEILSSLPLVSSGYIRFSITRLNPYTGYERLFKGNR